MKIPKTAKNIQAYLSVVHKFHGKVLINTGKIIHDYLAVMYKSRKIANENRKIFIPNNNLCVNFMKIRQKYVHLPLRYI